MYKYEIIIIVNYKIKILLQNAKKKKFQFFDK